MNRFVVHEHHARRLHWDFRLEVEGALKSWAVPKGPSMDPRQRRLAVETPDHELAYAGYEGVIPPGHYGAGEVRIWDQGVYEALDPEDAALGLRRGHLRLALYGNRLAGRFALVKMRGPGREKHWLLMKLREEEARSGWKMPFLNLA